MSNADDLEITRVRDSDVGSVLATLSAAYGREFDRDWFEWKHRSNPDGPSVGLAAIDESGLLGVVFRMAWPFVEGGRSIRGMRLVDGATSPTSGRRGVFSAIVRAHLNEWAATGGPGVVIATATEAARGSHVKNGAVALPQIGFRAMPIIPRHAALAEGLDVVSSLSRYGDEGRLVSSWSPDRLRWRLDARSGQRYRGATLRQADTPCGVVYVVRNLGPSRYMAVTTSWGSPREQRALIAAVAWRHRLVARVLPCGAGTPTREPSLSIGRGSSLVCFWDSESDEKPPNTRDLSTWALDGLDLEGTI